MPKYSLMAHQKEGVKFLDDHDGIGALLYDPGVGKTGTTLAWIDKQAKIKGEFRVLVVSPKTASDTWVLQAPPFMDSTVKARFYEGSTKSILTKIRDAGTWTNVAPSRVSANHRGDPNVRARVTIISISAGALSSYATDRASTVRVLQAVRKFAPNLVVLDESHIAKSATANISKVMYQIGQLADHRIALTGTVNPHSPLDCYGQWRFLAPWTFSDQYTLPYTKKPLEMTRSQKMSVRPWAWGRFQKRYALLGGYEGKVVQGVDPSTVDELHDRVAERAHVVRKEDALELPPVVDIDVHVTLTPAEQRVYDDMRINLAAQMADGSLLEAKNGLAKIMKLRQVTAGFVRDTETGVVHEVGKSKREAIKEVVNVRLAGENRVVVFAYFQSECAALAEMLAGPGRTVEVVTGKTHNRDRLAIRQRFGDVSGNPEQIVLIAQARTMSLSVNELVTAQHAVYASLSERREDWVQSRGRLDRNGQKGSKVTFWRVFVPDSIDQIMYESHERKGNMEKALLDHIRMTPQQAQ